MSKYEKVKYYYDQGLWDLYRVKMAVEKGWITKEEYKKITGKRYVAIKTDDLEASSL